MRSRLLWLTLGVGALALAVSGTRVASTFAQARAGQVFPAVPTEKGGQDIFGPYDVVAGWPKDISTMPGNEKWTWGSGQGVFAESADRVYLLHRGELPNIKRPDAKVYPDAGPAVTFGRLAGDWAAAARPAP